MVMVRNLIRSAQLSRLEDNPGRRQGGGSRAETRGLLSWESGVSRVAGRCELFFFFIQNLFIGMVSHSS